MCIKVWAGHSRVKLYSNLFKSNFRLDEIFYMVQEKNQIFFPFMLLF